ncbi:MAG: DUF512 domain-containing protein [Microthrixaceae bacterium]
MQSPVDLESTSAATAFSVATVVAVTPHSPAGLLGILPGDQVIAVDGRPLRDIIEYRVLTDETEVSLDLLRDGLELTFDIIKDPGTPLGIEIDSPVFDEVRTCDNHCEFCFIYQLPPGLRRSLYLKDDDYRLSFLYGNFTTLTRFTEADFERVVTQGLSPLYVSIHATDPELRSEMLRNRRGAMSLRWLRALLDHHIQVHGQVVVCPGINDGMALVDTLCGILDEYPELADVAVVPLGVSSFSTEPRMRAHTREEAQFVVDTVDAWQEVFLAAIGKRMVFAADEYYLLAQRPFPDSATYGDFSMHEDGIGMARAFQMEFAGQTAEGIGVQPGFFASVDGAPAMGYRAPRMGNSDLLQVLPSRTAPIGILTGGYGAQVLTPLLSDLKRSDVRIIEVENQFFGGNIAVTGLMVGQDLQRVLSAEPAGHRYFLPDVCLSQGRFLDGLTPADLPRAVEIIATDGVALRQALEPLNSSRPTSSETDAR